MFERDRDFAAMREHLANIGDDIMKALLAHRDHGHDSCVLDHCHQRKPDSWERCVLTRRWEDWREEMPWMSLYFSAAVWVSLGMAGAPRAALTTCIPSTPEQV